MISKTEAGEGTVLVSTTRVFTISGAAQSDAIVFCLVDLLSVMVETDWEITGWYMRHDVFMVCNPVRLGCLCLNEFGEVFITDSGLAKIDHSSWVSSLDQVHLSQKGKCSTEAVSGSFN
jgi:hypothetical protein